MEGFGLVECSCKKFKGYSKIEKVRKSELFDKFVGVEWRAVSTIPRFLVIRLLIICVRVGSSEFFY